MSPQWIPSLFGKWRGTEEGLGGRSLCVCVCLHGREKEEGGFLLQQGKEWDFQFSVEDNDKGGYQKGLKLHMLPGYQKIKGFTI